MPRLQMLVYRSDRYCRDKLSKCIELYLHPPQSKHFCWSLILCLHCHRSNAFVWIRADESCTVRIIVGVINREGLLSGTFFLSITFLLIFSHHANSKYQIIHYVLLHTLHEQHVYTCYPATKEVRWEYEEVAHSAPEQWPVPPHTTLSSKIQIAPFSVSYLDIKLSKS